MKTLLLIAIIILQSYALDRVEQFDREISELRESINTLKKENTLLKRELQSSRKTVEVEKKVIVEKPIIKYREKKVYIEKPYIKHIKKPTIKVVEKVVEKSCPIKNSFPELLMKN